MGDFKEYEQYDGLGLGELVRSKEVSPAELCEAAIKQIEKINPAINAVITPMSVPLQWTSDGLPCGMQFMAPMGDEATLFRLAGQLEEAKPWFEKRPALQDG